MIIKSHIRGGFRDAAAYLKEQGQNEKTRLVEMSDPHVQNLDEAFASMWAISDGSKVKKHLHHISINPMKDERLTDKQVQRICERLEERYGYAHGEHQRVIVEHIKEGRQHFHVMWNRVSFGTGKPHYPYMHKTQSKIVAREMEAELGLKKPQARKKTLSVRSRGESGRPVTIRAAGFGSCSGHVGHSPQVQFSSFKNLPRTKASAVPKETTQEQPLPFRPAFTGGVSYMCEAQRIDFEAACDGKITWKYYFEKWGKDGGNSYVFD